MNRRTYRMRNNARRLAMRLRYPPPLYKRVGGISAIVHRADGTTENLGEVSDTFARRWGVGSGR